MLGQAGADIFLFRTVADSVNTADADVISDFTVGEDRIDLSMLTSAPMELSILGGFTGTGPSARTFEVGASTLVYVDAEGDGVADMRIVVAGTQGLTEAEFIL